MRKFLLVALSLVLAFSMMAMASQYHNATKSAVKLEKAPVIIENTSQVEHTKRGSKSAPLQLNSILIDSARNGYGFSSSGPKSADIATDLFGTDYFGTAYRKFVPGDPATGIIGVAELDITAGFDYANFAFFDYINNVPGTTIGARYPSFAAAAEGPIPIWNQYDVAAPPGGETQSRAMLSFDFFGWGPNGGGFISPVDWAQQSQPSIVHSLWIGCTDLYQDANGLYHIGGVWEIDLNSGNYTFLHGTSTDLQTWTFNEGALEWSDLEFEMNGPRFAWGTNGFGAWVSTGYRDGGNDDFLLMMTYTEDYGATWSTVERYSFEKLGIPTYISAADSIYVPDPAGGPDILYEDSASVGITYDFDGIVDLNNEIHVGCTITWGPYADQAAGTYYPHGLHMGLYNIHSADKGVTWTDSRIWWPSGLLATDSSGSWTTTNEIDLGLDDAGNLYAAWRDRDPHVINPCPFPHSNSGITSNYMNDIWASISVDGGNTWAEGLQVTDDQLNSSYGVRLASNTKWYPGEDGKTYIMYQIADLDRPLAPPVETLTDHVQWYYVAEAKNFISGIQNENSIVAEKFSLEQNYPNPFNPTTNIRFTLAKQQHVEIAVYNTLGQQVAQLHNGVLAAGVHDNMSWNAADQPSGIYMLQLKTSEKTEVKKMMLVK